MARKKQTLTEQIYQELLKGLDEEGLSAYERLLSQYSGEKGPFYNAVSRALMEGKKKISEVRQELEEEKAKLKELAEERKKLDELVFGLRKERDGLQFELPSKKDFLQRTKELEELGFSQEMLKKLCAAIKEMEAERGLSGKEGLESFFEDLGDYDRKRGFELEVKRLEAFKEKLEKEKEEKEEELERLERRLKARRRVSEALDELLETHKLKKEQIISWSEVLWNAGIDVGDLEEEVKAYAGLKEAIRRKAEEKKKLEEELRLKRAEVEEVLSKKAEIESAIKELKEAGVKAVEGMGEEVKEKVKGTAEEVKREVEELYGIALEVGEKFGLIEKSLGPKEYLLKLSEFLSSPAGCGRDHPISPAVATALLKWLRKHQSSFRMGYSIENGLKYLVEELQ